MRLVLSILLVIVLLVLGAYYWLGLKTEKLYEGFVEFNESSGYTVNKEYNKGLFSSTATLEAMVGPRSKSYYKFVQTDRIEHGPFPISNTMFTKQKLSSAQNGAGAFSDEEIDRMAKASVEETLKELAAENLIVVEEGMIKIDLVFTGSRLTVNGNVIPLPIPGVRH